MKKSSLLFDLSGTLVTMRPPRLLIQTQLLQQLATNYNLAIVTGAQKTETLNILNKLGVSSLFTEVVTKDDTLYQKPNPQVVTQFLNLNSIQAYFGDTLKDSQLAANLNLPFYYIGKAKLGVYQNPDPNQLVKYYIQEISKRPL